MKPKPIDETIPLHAETAEAMRPWEERTKAMQDHADARHTLRPTNPKAPTDDDPNPEVK